MECVEQRHGRGNCSTFVGCCQSAMSLERGEVEWRDASGCLACVINDSATLLIALKDCDSFPSAEIPHNPDAPLFEGRDPPSWFGALVKSDRFRVAGPGTAQHAPDARPGNGSETHGAGLATGDEFMVRHAGSAKVEMPERVLRVGKGHHFRVSQRAGGQNNQVNSDRDQPPRPGFKDGRGERTARSVRHICRGQFDHKPHAIFIGTERSVRLLHEASRPLGQAERKWGETAMSHDGRVSCKVSKFLVTMRSPFFKETSMPVAMTVRHSSSRFKA
jgi:hypothetical protein